MLIGLTGYATSGKDTVADILKPLGFERVAFADALRESVQVLDPIIPLAAVREKVVRRHRYFIAGTPVFTTLEEGVYVHLKQALDLYTFESDRDLRDAWQRLKMENPEVRRLLQVMGTEVGRDMFGKNIWPISPWRKLARPSTRFSLMCASPMSEMQSRKRGA